MRRIVSWSGGADSTALLDHYAGASSEDYPVLAISISDHPNLISEQLVMEKKARKEYLKLARDRGYWISYQEINLGGSFNAKGPDGAGPPGQMWIWLTTISQCVGDGDEVMFSYIKGDSFWHYRHEFESAFNAIMTLKGVSAELLFPFEWRTKKEIMSFLKKAKIPGNCWWSCERPRANGTRCGRCFKCKDGVI